MFQDSLAEQAGILQPRYSIPLLLLTNFYIFSAKGHLKLLESHVVGGNKQCGPKLRRGYRASMKKYSSSQVCSNKGVFLPAFVDVSKSTSADSLFRASAQCINPFPATMRPAFIGTQCAHKYWFSFKVPMRTPMAIVHKSLSLTRHAHGAQGSFMSTSSRNDHSKCSTSIMSIFWQGLDVFQRPIMRIAWFQSNLG
jgi:hypothetical protein